VSRSISYLPTLKIRARPTGKLFNAPNGNRQVADHIHKLVVGHLLRLERWWTVKSEQRSEHVGVGAYSIIHPFGTPCFARCLPLRQRDIDQGDGIHLTKDELTVICFRIPLFAAALSFSAAASTSAAVFSLGFDANRSSSRLRAYSARSTKARLTASVPSGTGKFLTSARIDCTD